MKEQKDLVGLSRKSIVNQLHALTESKPTYDMHGLVKENWLKWLFRNLANLGNTHYSYQSYLKPEENNGIFKMSKEAGAQTSIALLSDWASDTAEAFNIAKLVEESAAEFTIHLGDTYYVGNYKEIAKCFNSTLGAPWPYGKLGSFALLGNHEMYSSGRSYFTQLLPYMGSHTKTGFQQQEASFFCLENDHWRIIGLDTGYDSLKGLLGLKAKLKLQLHGKQTEWLQNTVCPNDDNRGIIFLSHHQYVSAFEDEFTAFGNQLASLINPNKTVLWFWGHEHRLAIYGRNNLPNGTKIYPRCIGHGGMPVEIGEKGVKSAAPDNELNRNLVLYDNRVRNRIDGKINLGHNGFVILALNDNKLDARYYDDNKEIGQAARLICTEKWEVDLASGKVSGVDIRLEGISGEEKLNVFGNDIKKAIN